MTHWGLLRQKKERKKERNCHNPEDMLQLCIFQIKSKSLPKATFLPF
jgi:hypothetical protein